MGLVNTIKGVVGGTTHLTGSKSGDSGEVSKHNPSSATETAETPTPPTSTPLAGPPEWTPSNHVPIGQTGGGEGAEAGSDGVEPEGVSGTERKGEVLSDQQTTVNYATGAKACTEGVREGYGRRGEVA
ncbi:hypothetical protein JCM24511_04089 [Saitozyma sp. JCM 24511]|nr:hypothetical protein JCM24511_04089 [Saitozyma sp. JCM 24511]